MREERGGRERELKKRRKVEEMWASQKNKKREGKERGVRNGGKEKKKGSRKDE